MNFDYNRYTKGFQKMFKDLSIKVAYKNKQTLKIYWEIQMV